jgi:hypothetical protein
MIDVLTLRNCEHAKRPPAGLSRRYLLNIAVLLGAARMLPISVSVAASESPNPAQAMSLDDFVSLSRVLTGTNDLGREVAEIYLRYLTAGADGSEELTALWNAVDVGRLPPPQSLRELVEAGVFTHKNFDNTARAILKLWYTGRYEGDGVPKLAEYTDTLAWRAVGYTVAPSNCGGSIGFWADPPHAAEPSND